MIFLHVISKFKNLSSGKMKNRFNAILENIIIKYNLFCIEICITHMLHLF